LQRGRRRFVVNVAAAALAVVALTGSSLAQDLPPVGALPQAPVFKSTAALVALNVTVQDKSEKYVSGLHLEDFVVYEDGVKQDVQFFEADAVPVDLIVLIDTSSSMRDRMRVVHDAAAGFVSTLRPQDRGAVLSFADTVSVLQTLTSDRAALETAVRGTAAFGKTSLNNAVYVALKQFGAGARATGAVRRQAIVVLSDGADTSSLVSLDDVLAAARRSGVGIYTVSLQPHRERPVILAARDPAPASDYTMQALARETGARAFSPLPAQLKGVYRSIATEVASQYSIGYVPKDARADGRFRRVIVQIVTKPGLRLRTRPGYTDDRRSW
jgi:Ca-activated chloride channel family protein